MKGSDASAGVIPVEEGAVLALGPVRLPEYLDRPQIATRSEGNEVRLHETERWAGSLQEDVSRVMVEISPPCSPGSASPWSGGVR